MSRFGEEYSVTSVVAEAEVESVAELDRFWGATEMENIGRFVAFVVKIRVKLIKHKNIST